MATDRVGVGIDVAQATLVVAVRGDDSPWTVPNTQVAGPDCSRG